MEKNKNNNFILNRKKGFTMVELIVVLVILAILAAVAIPMMLGFTDDAKEKQYIAEAQEALAASQSMLSDVYTNNLVYIPRRFRDEALKTSGLDNSTEFYIYTVENFEHADGTSKTNACYTVATALYKASDGTYVYYNGSGWEVIPATDPLVSARNSGNWVKVWQADMYDTAGNVRHGEGDPQGNPEDEIIHDKEEEDTGRDEEITEVEPGPPSENPTRVILKLVGATDKVTFGENAVLQDEVTYELGKGLSKTPEVHAGLFYDYNSIKWQCERLPDSQDWKDLSAIGAYLCGIITPGTEQEFTLQGDASEKTVQINVSFRAHSNLQEVSLQMDDATDSNNDEIKDSLVFMYGMATHDISSTLDLNKVSIVSNALEEGAVTFDGNWAIRAGTEYLKNGNEYVTAKTKTAIEDEVSKWAKETIGNEPNNVEVIETVKSGVVFEAPADINKTVYVRGTLTEEGEPTRKVKFVDQTSQQEMYSFDVSFAKNELTEEIHELNEVGESLIKGEQVILSSDGTNDYSIFDNNELKTVFQPATLKLKYWHLYKSDKDGTSIDTEHEVKTREADCTKELIESLYAESNTKYGEVAEIDVGAQTTKLVSNSFNDPITNERFNDQYIQHCFISLVGSKTDVKSIIYVNHDDRADKSEIEQERCLSTTEVRYGNDGYLNRDSAGEYYAYPVDIDEDYPAYTVAYTLKDSSEKGNIYVVTEDDSDIKAVSSLKNFNNGFSAMTVNTVINRIDTTEVTEMSDMFKYCAELTSPITMRIDNAQKLAYTFYGAIKLTDVSLDAGETGAENLSSIDKIFSCDNNASSALRNVKFARVNSSNLTTLKALFDNRTNLTSVDLSGFHTEKISDFSYMFNNCGSLNSIKGPYTSQTVTDTAATAVYIDIPSAVDLRYMFTGAQYLTGIYLDAGEGKAENLAHTGNIFKNVTNLAHVAFKNIDSQSLTTLKEYNCSGLFEGKAYLTDVDLSGFHTERIQDFSYMFNGCSSLNSIIGPYTSQTVTDTAATAVYIDIPSAVDLRYMFTGAQYLTGIYLDAGEGKAENLAFTGNIFKNVTNLTHVAFKNVDSTSLTTLKENNCQGLFEGRTNLADVDMTGFNTSRISDFESMFNSCENLVSVKSGDSVDNPEYAISLHIDSATSIYKMFRNCLSAQSISLLGGGKDRDSGLSNILQVFEGCNSIKKIEFKDLKSTALDGFHSIFLNKRNLESVTFTRVDLPGITDMGSLFNGCTSLKYANFDEFNTSNVTNMSYMFYDCRSLERLNLSEFDTSKVTTMQGMFGNSTSGDLSNSQLKILDISSFTTNALTDIRDMFIRCHSLETIYVEPTQWKHDLITPDYGTNVFLGCTSLKGTCGSTPVDSSTGETYSQNSEQVSSVFAIADEDEGEDLNNSNGTNEHGYFTAKIGTAMFTQLNCKKVNGTPQNWPEQLGFGVKIDNITGFARCTEQGITEDNVMTKHPSAKDITDATYVDPATGRRFKVYGWLEGTVFYWWSEAGKVYINEYNYGMFNFYYREDANNKPTALVEVDFQGIDTSKVKNCERFFSDAQKLVRIYDKSKGDDVDYRFKTDAATGMVAMFGSCHSLTSLNLSGANTSKVTSMKDMFQDVVSIETLDLSSFSSEALTNCSSMFNMRNDKNRIDGKSKPSDVTVLSSVIFGNGFSCKNATDMSNMFRNCKSITELDLSPFDCSTVTVKKNLNVNKMFEGCNVLTTIYVTDPDSDPSRKGFYNNVEGRNSRINSSGDMFNNCTSLVGSKGSRLSNCNNTKDATYARVDKEGQKGYFTAK